MEEVRRRIEKGVSVGETARFELTRADAEVMNAASRKEAAHLNVQRARSRAHAAHGWSFTPNFEIQGIPL